MTRATHRVVPTAYLDLLAQPALAHVATIGPDGEPQSTPVWFDWDGEVLRIALAPFRQKYRNLRRDPRVAISIVDPANPVRHLEIRGRVTDVTPDPDYTFVNRLVRKYTGADSLPSIQGDRFVVTIEPVHTTSMG
jgi:PPOX class probable F420-dependent enzyme